MLRSSWRSTGLAGQAINADLVGPMRDQITTRVCFQVARREISRTVVYRPGGEQNARTVFTVRALI